MVADFTTGEWLRYTLKAETAGPRPVTLSVRGTGGRLSLTLNGGAPVEVALPAASDIGWRDITAPALPFAAGTNTLILRAEACDDCAVSSLSIRPSP